MEKKEKAPRTGAADVEVGAVAAAGSAAVLGEPVARQPADLPVGREPEAAAARPEHDRRRHCWAVRERRPARMGVRWRRSERGGGQGGCDHRLKYE